MKYRLAYLRPKPTLRMRLTLVYAGLFVCAGLVMLAVTYVLTAQRLPRADSLFTVRIGRAQSDTPLLRTPAGDTLNADEAIKFFAAQQAQLRHETLTQMLIQGGVALAVVSVVAAGLGWLIAGRVLAPLHRVTETARRIATAPAAERGLHERIGLAGPDDEVKELAEAFDTMVGRLERSFDGQRRFVSHASHELRTPLTLNRALVEVAMHRRAASPDVLQLGQTLLEINTRHERLINGLLLLARSENEVLQRSDLDLADVVSHVVGQSAAEAAQAGVEVRVRPGEAHTTGDAILLERLAQNLVENGIRHNVPRGGSVEVVSRTLPGGRVQLEVSNSGPVIPPYDIPMLFEPFRRLDDRLVTAKGAGLGLSIVRSIAHAHGGEVVARARAGGGLIVTVNLR